jgi:glutamyl-tRNA(Gln) amidotransferase subunit D
MAELNFNPGDKVRLRLAKKEQDGTVLESYDSSVLLLKLESGYNIGIPNENILGGRILKKHVKDKEFFEEEINVGKSGKKKIGLVMTGGTIASKLDPKTGGAHALTSVREMKRFYPELFSKVDLEIQVPFMAFTENMDSGHWIKIAESVKSLIDRDDIEGVVVTHGTDFLGYTGAALSFYLGNLGKPVVLTYSQKSVDRASSDAHLNLQCAAEMAVSDCAGVFLVGHASVNDDYCRAIKGTKARKSHSSRRDAFEAVNDIEVAKVWPDKVEFIGGHDKRDNSKEIELDIDVSDKVALVKFYPGQDPSILDFYSLKYKGVVVEGSGLGHLPIDGKHSWLPKLKKHIRDGFVVCLAGQTLGGRVNPKVYSTGRLLEDAGVIYLEDMLPETALVKLGWILGHHGWKKNVKVKMLENVSGELNESIGLMD